MHSYVIESGEKLLFERIFAIASKCDYCVGAIAWKGRYTKCTCVQDLFKFIPPVITINLSRLIVANYLMNLFRFIAGVVVNPNPAIFRAYLLKFVSTSRANGVRSTPKLSFKCDFYIDNLVNSPLLFTPPMFDYIESITICTHTISYVMNFSKEEYNYYFDKKMVHDRCFNAFMVKIYLVSNLSRVTEMHRYENFSSTRINWKFVIENLMQNGITVNDKTIRQYYNNNMYHFSDVVNIPFSPRCNQLGFHVYFPLSKNQTKWIFQLAPSISNKQAWNSVSMYKYIQYTNPSSRYGSLNGFTGLVYNSPKINNNDSEPIKIARELDDLIKEKLDIGYVTIHLGFMFTKSNAHGNLIHPQDPHVDFSWEDIDKNQGNMFFGIMSLSEEGCFLEVWIPTSNCKDERKPELILIPFGYMLILPADMVHAGGFCSNDETGDIRMHLYIYSKNTPGTLEKKNNYCDRSGIEMCSYMNHHHLLASDAIFNCIV